MDETMLSRLIDQCSRIYISVLIITMLPTPHIYILPATLTHSPITRTTRITLTTTTTTTRITHKHQMTLSTQIQHSSFPNLSSKPAFLN
jgi:hypothetical protein